MFRFIWAIFVNLYRGPKFIPTMRKMAKHPEKYSEEARYKYAQYVINAIRKSAKIDTEFFGVENLPEEGGYVMFPNHQGKYDVLGIIYGHEKPCTFVMDKDKSYTFMVKEIVDLIGAKRLEIDNVRQNMKIITEMTEEVKAGKRYIIFSEGGYAGNKNKVQEFKPGSFKSATRAQAPIVPVALIDSYKAFNSRNFGRINTKVIFLKPLYYDEYKDLKTPEIAEIVKRKIIDAMKEYGVEAE